MTGGVLAATGWSDATTLWLILGLALVVLGFIMVVVVSRRNRRDAVTAGVTRKSRRHHDLL